MSSHDELQRALAILIAVAVPSSVWLLNGILPLTALVLGASLGLFYWHWRPLPPSDDALATSGSTRDVGGGQGAAVRRSRSLDAF